MAQKQIDVVGICSGLVDIIIDVTEEELASVGLAKGSARIATNEEQQKLLKRFDDRVQKMVGGGSVANSIVAIGQLGGKGGIITCLGDDRYGLHYRQECELLNIDMALPSIVGGNTGLVISLITPDGERSMLFYYGVASQLSDKFVEPEIFTRAKWLFIEGYMFTYETGLGQKAIAQAIKHAKANNCKIALTLSESWVVENFKDAVNKVIDDCDFVFANEAEVKALTGASDGQTGFEKLLERVPGGVVTLGAQGALVCYNGQRHHARAFPCDPRDLTGAGDMLAGSILYGITNNLPLADTANRACFLAMQVITRIGARIQTGVRAYWDTCVSL